MIGALVRHDVRLQYRSGFHLAYLFVCLSYAALLRLVPLDLRALILPPVLLSEASVVGFFFAGALLHFERGDGVLHALAVSPARTADYLVARVLSLTLLNTSVALLITAAGGVPGVNYPLLAVAAALTSAVFTLLGVAVACRFTAIERFVVLGGLISALFGLAVFPFFGILESPFWRVLPTDAALRLLGTGTGALIFDVPMVVASVLVLLTWSAAMALIAVRWVERYALGRQGGRQ